MRYYSIIFSFLIFILCGCGPKTKTITVVEQPKDEELTLPSVTEIIPHDIIPVLLKDAKCLYPRLAEEGGFSSEVSVSAFVGSNGIVKKVIPGKTSRPNMGFEEEAVRAAYDCIYKPAENQGSVVGVWIKYVV